MNGAQDYTRLSGVLVTMVGQVLLEQLIDEKLIQRGFFVRNEGGYFEP